IAEAIRSARSHVHLAGWHFDASFRLEQDGPTLRELLAETAERVDVRVLAWAGAPLPLFHPARGEVRQACHELAGGTRIAMALDARERPFHCHHEKLVVVDDETALVGGSALRALRAAERLVYLESQFLWSPEVTFVLAEKLARPPCDDFRVIALLPAQPNNGADDSRGQVGILIDADKESGDDTTRFLACTLYQ